jgi:hypothetical protein
MKWMVSREPVRVSSPAAERVHSVSQRRQNVSEFRS